MLRFASCFFLWALPVLVFAQSPTPVADQTFKVEGTQEFAYGFAEGDKVDLHVELIAGRQLKVVEFLRYPDQTLFQSYELDTVLNKTIQIPQTGLYVLRLTEKGLSKKICRFTLQRTPTIPENTRMNTYVGWDWHLKQPYKVSKRSLIAGKKTEMSSLGGQVTVSASKLGLKNAVNAYQFTLPPHTIQWAYRVSVGQATIDARKRDTEKITGGLKLGAAKLLGYEPTSALAIYALGMAIDLTVSKSGEDVTYALLNADNLAKFKDGKEYDTFIYQSGVSVDAQRRYAPLEGSFYFGFRNNNWLDDITVSVDIEAVTEVPQFVTEWYLEPN
jgi:hypothetical protein